MSSALRMPAAGKQSSALTLLAQTYKLCFPQRDPGTPKVLQLFYPINTEPEDDADRMAALSFETVADFQEKAESERSWQSRQLFVVGGYGGRSRCL